MNTKMSERYRDLDWSLVDDHEVNQIDRAYTKIRDWYPGMSHEAAWTIVERWLLKRPKSVIGRLRREASLKYVAERMEAEKELWEREIKKKRAAGKVRDLIIEYRLRKRD
jgi:hypothetical protein